MEQDHVLSITVSTQPEEEPSSAPATLRAHLRLIPNGPAHPTDQVRKAKARVPQRRTILWLIQGTTSVAPQVVGVRDQESGVVRMFTVYHPASGVAPDGDPPDPDVPPAGPAQSGARARLAAATDEVPGDWPHTRAA